MNRQSGKSTRRKKRNQLRIVNGALWLLFTLMLIYLFVSAFRYHLLQVRLMNLLVVVAVMVAIIGLGWLILRKKAQIIILTFLILASVTGSVAVYAFREFTTLSEGLNATANYSEYEMSVVVLADSPLTDIKQVKDVMAPVDIDNANITTLVENIKQSRQSDITVTPIQSYQAAYKALVNKEAQAIILHSAFENILESEDPDFSSKIRKLYTYKVSKKTEGASPVSELGDSMNIYISGIDTYGPISSVSRSDVNIIMTVNRQTKKVLLTTTPRDAYVPIADGGNNQNDKLTHAGIYGVDASIHTLEKLYGIDINYYARLNFTSFLKLIDLVGGVDVINDQEFTGNGGTYFPVGNVHMDSKQALEFVRERYSLQGGDNDRGKNQEKVIAALIKKLTSTDALKNYNQILDGLQDSIQTNMNAETIISLVNAQLASRQSYTVTSQAVTGDGSMELPSYAMPDAQLYMLQLDQNSLTAAKEAIQAVMEGK